MEHYIDASGFHPRTMTGGWVVNYTLWTRLEDAVYRIGRQGRSFDAESVRMAWESVAKRKGWTRD